jgi:hypothetical protein
MQAACIYIHWIPSIPPQPRQWLLTSVREAPVDKADKTEKAEAALIDFSE